MRLEKDLHRVAATYLNDIRLIGEFISDIEGFLTIKENSGPKSPLTLDELKQLRHLGETVMKSAEKAKHSESQRTNAAENIVIRIDVSDRVGAYALQLIKPIKQRTYLVEMSLSYLISYQEAFIKDYLYQLLVHKHQLLKSSSSISYEEVVEHHSVRTLWSALAKKEVDSLGYGSIDNVATYFSNKLNIDLSSFTHWDLIREHNYRRNLIIHNRGKVNEAYRKKVGAKQRTGRLVTDFVYVASAVENVVSFIEFIHASILKKFRKISR